MGILLLAERLRRDKGKRACALQVDCLRHSLRKCPLFPQIALVCKKTALRTTQSEIRNQASHGDSKARRKRRHGGASASGRAVLKV